MYPFSYHRPTTLEEASALLETCDDARLLAGGMTLLPSMKLRLNAASDVIDIAAIAELRGLNVTDEEIVMGAMTTHCDVASHQDIQSKLPALSALAEAIGDAQVRNRGTIGGAVANNDPAADYPAALVALGAVVQTTRRDISADAFFVGMFETALDPNEIVVRVRFPIPKAAAWDKVRNAASGYADVGVFAAQNESGFRVAVTGYGTCVFRWSAAEHHLETPRNGSTVLEITPPDTDLDADDYKLHLLRRSFRRAALGCGITQV